MVHASSVEGNKVNVEYFYSFATIGTRTNFGLVLKSMECISMHRGSIRKGDGIQHNTTLISSKMGLCQHLGNAACFENHHHVLLGINIM